MATGLFTSGDCDADEIVDGVTIYRRVSALESLQKTSIAAALVDDFIEVVNTAHPTVIHAHHSMPILLTKIVCAHFPVPSVYTQHRTPELPGNTIKLDGKGVLGEAVLALRGDGIWVAPSHFFKRRLVQAGFDDAGVQVIWPSVDSSMFRPMDNLIARRNLAKIVRYDASKRLVVLPVVPRPRKDVDFAIDALKDSTVALLITGLKSDSPELDRLKRQYPSADIIEHLPLSLDQVALAMNAADCVVMSSTHEGFGLAALESLSTGAVSLLRDVAGMQEIAGELSQAKTFSTKEELARYVNDAVPLPLEDKKWQHAAVARVFAASTRAARHIEVYNQAAQNEYSAGGICIAREHDEKYVCAIMHTSGRYVLPKGHLKQGESLELAAIREIKEEAGLDVGGGGIVCGRLDYDFARGSGVVKKHSTFFAYCLEGRAALLPQSIDHTEDLGGAEWVKITPDLRHRFMHQSEYALVQKAAELYA